jgi:hypothetical protein
VEGVKAAVPGGLDLEMRPTCLDGPTKSSLEGSLLIVLRRKAKELHIPQLALAMSDCGMIVHKKNDGNSLDQQPESTHAQTN